MALTQIYLTEQQQKELGAISKAFGKNQSELIREAVDNFIEKAGVSRRESILREAAGIWKDRTDIPDFEALWDREHN